MRSRAISGILSQTFLASMSWNERDVLGQAVPSSPVRCPSLVYKNVHPLKKFFIHSPHESFPRPSLPRPCLSRLPRTCHVSPPSLTLLRRDSNACRAMGGDDGHPDGHLGTTWEVIVAVSLGRSSACFYAFKHQFLYPGLLLFIAATTIIIVTIRRRRRKLDQPKQSDFAYSRQPPPTFLPSMAYGISRVRQQRMPNSTGS